jgi:hypothetical protein
MLALGLFEGTVALIDWLVGPVGVSLLNPLYAQTLFNYLKGSPYRPFGTTHLPGNPGVWMYHCSVAAALSLFLLREGWVRRPALWRVITAVYVPVAAMTLIVCQIRLAIIRTALVIIGASFLAGRRQALISLLIFGTLGTAYFVAPPTGVAEDVKQHTTLNERLLQAVSRARTLERGNTWTHARGGWAWQELARRARFSMTGVGLSRVGASSRPWQALIDQDRIFGPNWTFADNVVLAVFTELGVGGLLTYLLMNVGLLAQLAVGGSPFARLCFLNCALMLFSGYASEGILFQPDASFFWAFAAMGLRYRARQGEAPC